MRTLRVSLVSSLVLGMSFGCGQERGRESPRPPPTLQVDTLRFAQETHLLESEENAASGGASGFQGASFAYSAYRPTSFLFVPTRAASFFQQRFAAMEGFRYKAFAFASAGCNADAAFARYFAALESLSGTTLPSAAQEKVSKSFDGIFAGLGAEGSELRCLIFDMISCVADYAVLNAGEIAQSGKAADPSAIATGVASCISEVFGSEVVMPVSTTASP